MYGFYGCNNEINYAGHIICIAPIGSGPNYRRISNMVSQVIKTFIIKNLGTKNFVKQNYTT